MKRVSLVWLLCVLIVLPAACSAPEVDVGGTPGAVPFRSDQFHLQATLPPGWAAAEGPKRLVSPFVGVVAFNSWGEADFWAPALMEGDSSTYWALSALAQVPDGEAYVVLIYHNRFPSGVEKYGPEHEQQDLADLWELRDCRQAGGVTWVNFHKWGRLFRLEVYCRPDASDAVAAAADDLIASWRFDRVVAGDPGWASAQARSLLPPAALPERFPVLAGEFADRGPLRAPVKDGVATRSTRAEIQGETVVVTFMWRRDDLPLDGSGGDCPPDRCHWWRFEARPTGEVALIGEGGAALAFLGMEARYSDPVLGFALEYPSDWQVEAPVNYLDTQVRAWTVVPFRSDLYAYGEQAFGKYAMDVAVGDSEGRTLTETVEYSLSSIGPQVRDGIEIRCCLTVGGEPAMELLYGWPMARWGSRQIIVHHHGWEYRLNFYPYSTLDGNTASDAAARAAFDTFLHTFTFIPITVTPTPLAPTITPVPTPSLPAADTHE